MASSALINLAQCWDISTQQRYSNALVDVGGLGVDGAEVGRISALADVNGDQYIDLLGIDTDKRQISIYTWNHDGNSYQRSSTLSAPFDVASLVATDVDGDGIVDVVAVGERSSAGGLSDELPMILYRGSLNNSVASYTDFDTLPSVFSTQPTFVDAGGALLPDYIGYAASSRNALQLFSNHNGTFSDPTPLNFDGETCTLAHPHSNAFIDLNGDCLADVFLVCEENNQRSFQIWLNDANTESFSLHSHTALPKGSGMVTFADFNRDGNLDMVFPTCASIDKQGVGHDCHINVWYNEQIPLCVDRRSFEALLHPSLLHTDHCRNPSDLCVADNDFTLNGTANMTISVDTLTNNQATLKMLDKSSSAKSHSQPLLLRLGDFNLDGFSDILAVMHFTDGSDRGVVIENVPSSNHTRSLVMQGGGGSDDGKFAALSNIHDARVVSWLDIDDDGTLDIMVQRYASENNPITFIQNNIPNDAFFIKTLLLNGACDVYCTNTLNEKEKYKAFGASLIGGSYKFTILDTSGGRHAASFAQIPSTAFDALYTPYSFMGLGRTNNYIENLHVGSTFKLGASDSTSNTSTASHTINFEGIIPNAQVVITPSNHQHSWRIEMYLKKNKWVPFVALVVSTLCLILGAVVFGLHIHEKKEDEIERKKESHHINFQAL